jgi:diadenosine tetraphosphatase ApaH/serine/threonine PP2A family protein phosphatase
LTTVFDDIDKRGIKTVYCLGDIVGYAANPKECLDMIIERTEFSVMGNHDYAVLYEPTNFNTGAERASYWTRDVLERDGEKDKARKRWSFLGSQQMRRQMRKKLGNEEVDIDLVHASPNRPINEYVFPDDIYSTPLKITTLLERVKHICFIGHTHLPGVFLGDPDFYTPDELGGVYPIVADEKAIINVGSVGQPRDRDNRASYAYIEGNEVHFVRLEYDYEATAKKIYDTEMLDNFEGDRLFDGR